MRKYDCALFGLNMPAIRANGTQNGA